MKISVTGASGHLGNVICRKLLESGHEVIALYNSDNRAIKELNLTSIRANVLLKDDLIQAFKECEVVIHTAAMISIHGDKDGRVFKTNTQGVTNVLEAALENGVKKIIHVSSTHAVLEEPLDQVFDESRPYKKASNFAYDYSKAKGEQLVLDFIDKNPIEACIVRPSSILGPYDFKPSELGKALIDFKNRKVPLLPPGGYDFVDVRDVANGIIEAIEKGRNREIYLLTGHYLSIKELAKKIGEVTKVKVPQRVIPFWCMKVLLPFVKCYGFLSKAAPVFTIESISALKYGHPNMSKDKAQKVFGHKPRKVEESLKDFYNWIDKKEEQ